jgi:hypothetical protein
MFGFLTSRSQSYIYHPFPEDTATWVVDNVSNTCTGINSYCYSDVFKMKGDTLINGISYNKIYWQQVKFYYINFPPNQVVGRTYLTPEIYWAGLRQDIPNKKVFITSSTNSDTLLYDFNLQLGDTLPQTYLQNGWPQPSIVTQIDSILIGIQYHKSFLLNFWTAEPFTKTLIEGVGSGGRLNSVYSFFESGPKTVCFNNNQIATPCIWGSCSLYSNVISVNEIDPISKYKISPNPFSSQTVLETASQFHNATLTIYDSFGQTKKMTNNLSGQKITLNRDNLPSGLYFIRLTQDSKTLAVIKIIITDN